MFCTQEGWSVDKRSVCVYVCACVCACVCGAMKITRKLHMERVFFSVCACVCTCMCVFMYIRTHKFNMCVTSSVSMFMCV